MNWETNEEDGSNWGGLAPDAEERKAKKRPAVAPSRSAAPKDDPICINCGEPESNHAMIGDWCRSESEDKIWSTIRKFVAPASAAPPSERDAQFTAEFLKQVTELSEVLDKMRPGTGGAVAMFCQDAYEKGWQARAAVPQAPAGRDLDAIFSALSKLESQILRDPSLPEAYRLILADAWAAVRRMQSGAAAVPQAAKYVRLPRRVTIEILDLVRKQLMREKEAGEDRGEGEPHGD